MDSGEAVENLVLPSLVVPTLLSRCRFHQATMADLAGPESTPDQTTGEWHLQPPVR
jgi:hypothetical protein